jgi:uncharacterized damage-inducible protein DinB
MYAKIAGFVVDWKQETARTAKLFDALTDTSLAQAVLKDDRTLGRLAWHIVLSQREMLGRTGLVPTSVQEDDPVPSTAASIAAAYKAVANEVAALVQTHWADATLAVEDDMYGMRWPRGLTLQVMLRHEIHHRGQMTVLMRQAGLAVPGIYGPSREEWAHRGVAPPKI